MQHVNIKLFAEQPYPEDLAAAIPVFHRWIQQRALPGVLVDVADYAHVPQGPGVLLIGHEYTVSLDQAGGRLGVLYNRKAAVEGTGTQSLAAAFAVAESAAQRLESEPEFAGKLRFGRDEVEILLNDRLLYPNNAATLEALRPELDAFLGELFGSGFTLQHNPDPRLRFAVTAKRAN